MALEKQRSVLFVASECFPLIKTGGLADVVGALPLALEKTGLEVTVFLPGFPAVLGGLKGIKTLAKLASIGERPGKLVTGKTETGLSIIALDAPHFFGIEGKDFANCIVEVNSAM